jgi:hypothetical protein
MYVHRRAMHTTKNLSSSIPPPIAHTFWRVVTSLPKTNCTVNALRQQSLIGCPSCCSYFTLRVCALCQYISLSAHGRSSQLFTIIRAQSVSVGFHHACQWGLSMSLCLLAEGVYSVQLYSVLVPQLLYFDLLRGLLYPEWLPSTCHRQSLHTRTSFILAAYAVCTCMTHWHSPFVVHRCLYLYRSVFP